jgi:hypothetical protein
VRVGDERDEMARIGRVAGRNEVVSSRVSSPSFAPSGMSAAKTTIQMPRTTHLPRRLETKDASALTIAAL